MVDVLNLLDFCIIEYRLEALSPLHAGTGEVGVLPNNGNSTEKDRTFALIQRNNAGKPAISANSLRGGARSAYEKINSVACESLLGHPDGQDENADSESRLWLHPLVAEAHDDATIAANSDLPHYNKDTQSFVLTGNRLKRDYGAVQDKLLFNVEYVPEGTVFEGKAIFRGTFGEFEAAAGPFFQALAEKQGFAIGADKGHGFGVVRIVDETLTVTEHVYDCSQSGFKQQQHAFATAGANGNLAATVYAFNLLCEGPFFISDPERAKKDRNGPDLVELRASEQNPFLSGKPVLQALRAISARIETNSWLEENAFAYESAELPLDNPDRHLGRKENPFSCLSATQRLFGVPGWGKLIRIDFPNVSHPGNKRYLAQGLELDTFLQSPIHGALFETDVPAQVKLSLRFWLEEARYRNEVSKLKSDKEHFNKVLNAGFGAGKTFRLGHATGAGFGWFKHCSEEVQSDG